MMDGLAVSANAPEELAPNHVVGRLECARLAARPSRRVLESAAGLVKIEDRRDLMAVSGADRKRLNKMTMSRDFTFPVSSAA
jgi:hypothetical protein